MLSPIDAIFVIKLGGGVVDTVDLVFCDDEFVAFWAVALRKLTINTTKINWSFIAAVFFERANFSINFSPFLNSVSFYFVSLGQFKILSLHLIHNNNALE